MTSRPQLHSPEPTTASRPPTVGGAAADSQVPTRLQPLAESVASTDHPDATPTPFFVSLPRYQFLESLGHGGMGHVVLAFDTQLKRRVALKFMLKPAEASEAARRRFAAESAILAQMHHPNVVEVHDSGEVGGYLFYSMTHLPGGSLHKRREEFRTRAERAVGVVADLAGGVQHAHEKGIFHRDLKASNVMFDGDRPVVTDFGCAKWEDGELSTQGFALFGTPTHMAPEVVVRGSKDHDARADVWGLGVMLYHLLAGELPFPDDPRTPAGRLSLMNGEPKELRDCIGVSPGVDDRLEAVVRKALAKNPDERYQTVAAFGLDLRRWLAGESIDLTPIPREGLRLYPPAGKRWWLVTTGVVGVLAVAAGITMAAWPRGEVRSLGIAEQVNGGEAAVLVDGDGRFRHPMLKASGFTGGIETDPAEGAVAIDSGSVLVATFDAADLKPPYTLRADVHHLLEHDGAEVGIFVLERMLPSGEHAFVSNTFRGEANQPKGVFPRAAEAYAGGRVVDLTELGFPLADFGRPLTRKPIDRHPFAPPGTPREYRRLSLVVTEEGVRADQDGMVIADLNRTYLRSGAAALLQADGPPVAFEPYGVGLGVVVRNGCGLFRNVVIEPNR